MTEPTNWTGLPPPVGGGESAGTLRQLMSSSDPAIEYPLGSGRPDLIQTPSGLGLEDLSIETLREDRIPKGDVRITPATLRLQAQVARQAGRVVLAANLERAAELTAVPDDVILDLYSSLRPGRSTAEDLERWVTRLEEEFSAPRVAEFVREAIGAYRGRGIIR